MRRTFSFTAANPSCDKIRQDIELANGIGDKIPSSVPDYIFSRRDDLPSQWLRDLLQAETADNDAEMLTLHFYRIEVGEKRRFQGVMSHHSRRRPTLAQFLFSTTAGIEMGTKDRFVVFPPSCFRLTTPPPQLWYRNIELFEHARVRLRTISATDSSAYVNASYFQPMVTKRRYIATQGPPTPTLNDFWT